LIEIINKQLLLQLVGYLCYWQMGFNSVFKGLISFAEALNSMYERRYLAKPSVSYFPAVSPFLHSECRWLRLSLVGTSCQEAQHAAYFI